MVRVYVMSVTANLDAVGIYLREWRSLPAPELAACGRGDARCAGSSKM
jgi:hypothetical protein